MMGQLQGQIASLGRGGCRHFEPHRASDWWECSEATTIDFGGPTQRHGRNLDWFLASRLAPLGNPEAVVIAGTDHVGVPVPLAAVRMDTVRVRLKLPAPLAKGDLKHTREDYTREKVETAMREPLRRRDVWMQAAKIDRCPGGGG